MNLRMNVLCQLKKAIGCAVLLTVPLAFAGATPILDGDVDAEYGAAIATSPKDNLLVDPVNAIDDNTATANPSPKSFDVTDMYVTNSGDALFVYIKLPYLDLNNVYGDWGIVMHLGGANDTTIRLGTVSDSYGAPIYFLHTDVPNAMIKSNCRTYTPSSDGNNGWAYVNQPNTDLAGWDFPGGNQNLFHSNRTDNATGTIHGYGLTGAEIVYKAGDGSNGGIEMRIPFTDFATNGKLTAPTVGDVIKMQWYGTTRTSSNGHERGAIDCVPFEAASRLAPGSTDFYPWASNLSAYATFTIKPPVSFDVVSGAYTDQTHVSVVFSDSAGAGADVPANYTLTDVATSAVIPVTAAAIDGTNPKKVNLTTATLTYTHKYKVVVSGVKSTGGTAVGEANSTTIQAPGQVKFRLWDPNNIVGTQGIDPNTSQPGQITVTGSFNNWANNGDGTVNAAEILVNPVVGQPNMFESDIVLLSPGISSYKYRMPVLLCGAGCLAWDLLNNPGDPNRRVVVPENSEGLVQTFDIAVNSTTPGAAVLVTFTMVDNNNLVAGRQVQIAGNFNSWNSDPATGLVMTPVSGQANTYSATTQINQGYIEYKYVVKPDPVGDPNNTLWDLFGGTNQYSTIIGEGNPLAQTITNIFGVPPVPTYLKALRIAAGFEIASAADKTALDVVIDGQITVADAVKLLKP